MGCGERDGRRELYMASVQFVSVEVGIVGETHAILLVPDVSNPQLND